MHMLTTPWVKKIHSVFSHNFVNAWRQSGMFFGLTVYILSSIKLSQNLSWKHTVKYTTRTLGNQIVQYCHSNDKQIATFECLNYIIKR